MSGLESKKPRLTGRTMQGVLKLPAWIGAAAKCGACINLCTLLLLLAKTGDCTFVLGTLGAGILSTCPHVPHRLKARPRQLATLSTQTCCNSTPPQNLMKRPQKAIKRNKNHKKRPKNQHISHGLNPGLKARPQRLATLFTRTPSITPKSIFLLSTKTPPTVIHGFMARKELLGLHAARLQGATKY